MDNDLHSSPAVFQDFVARSSYGMVSIHFCIDRGGLKSRWGLLELSNNFNYCQYGEMDIMLPAIDVKKEIESWKHG